MSTGVRARRVGILRRTGERARESRSSISASHVVSLIPASSFRTSAKLIVISLVSFAPSCTLFRMGDVRCGLCQQYVDALASATEGISRLPNRSRASTTSSGSDVGTINTEAVNTESIAARPPLFIILISSGSPSLIPKCRFPVSGTKDCAHRLPR